MDRVRRWLSSASSQTAYEPIHNTLEADAVSDGGSEYSGVRKPASHFSRLSYGVFFLLGINMLWAWNMFLAAAPYFHRRFESDDWAVAHFQPSILSVSTVTNLCCGFIMAKAQKNASYPRRIKLSLLINIIIFALLAFSTILMKNAVVGTYFGFLMLMVFGASWATGMNQNGVFAYVSGFGREEYTQAIMAGQGVAGVLPCIVQILSVLAVPPSNKHHGRQDPSKSAFAYFLTATAISLLALIAFLYLDNKRQSSAAGSVSREEEDPLHPADAAHAKTTIGLWTLFKKLHWPALSVFLCFAVTMTFPVFTAEIESVHGPGQGRGVEAQPRIFEPEVFIPLAFLFWNVGDLFGRISVLVPRLATLSHRPVALFVLAIARLGFIPLYLLCNIGGRGAIVNSDAFYLFFVQICFGFSNGFLGSSCMMGAGHFVSVEEREPAGGFMSLMLVGGLAAGSLLSFLIAAK
ncbi:hypothetical protein ASPZODRAFT_72475 [Penicilliopsis zonata CBS 506.65]|uniref:Major facilitator superfamily (MFS) profile domain-containing protein n=1 Tax=Penicilliopsis zonata CBS 506.65 TaxID=1073090 RepID=A0A1L9SAF6_9EURO|nr:hypothetical protein ASPZODRAFT_72475 [Penicilliopsis zonata CBS 506.65]OJJ44107.1 hypothetical protein ASPZODRAFT_72475 [Penicilliopsis zonata CBS 506.65]